MAKNEKKDAATPENSRSEARKAQENKANADDQAQAAPKPADDQANDASEAAQVNVGQSPQASEGQNSQFHSVLSEAENRGLIGGQPVEERFADEERQRRIKAGLSPEG